MTGICITGSAVGGPVETQECMDFFAEKDIRYNKVVSIYVTCTISLAT
jgi:D-arabinose 1-dehydrogenase-like Zn-dependent alcohol dehydrogenase